MLMMLNLRTIEKLKDYVAKDGYKRNLKGSFIS